jgi:TRAP-type C4-dicarboxylate transport system permease small subunit
MKNGIEIIAKVEMFIAKYALAVLSALVFFAAVARCFHYPIVWAVDAATFLFAWCVFLGGDIAFRENKLFCIVIVTCKLSPKWQAYVKLLNQVIISVFLAGMIFYGAWLTYTTRLRTFQGIPGFSYSWATLSVPVGCLLMLITSLRKITQLVIMIKEGAFTSEDECFSEVI